MLFGDMALVDLIGASMNQDAGPHQASKPDMLMKMRKEEALALVAELPAEFDVEELIYRLCLRENPAAGEEDFAAGRTLSVQCVGRQAASWIAWSLIATRQAFSLTPIAEWRLRGEINIPGGQIPQLLRRS
jgi:hypothetical protein